MPGASGWPVSLSASSGGCVSARPSTRSIASRGRPPGRSSIGVSKQPTMVDFDADRDRAAVDDQIDAPGEVALHMRRGGRRDMARQIGGGRHHRPAESAQDVPRHAGARERGSRRYRARRWRDRRPGSRRLWQHQRQRPRPEGLRQPRRGGIETGDPPGRGEVGDMGDQGIEGGPALGLIEPGNGGRIGGIGAEAIDGLGRERDQAAFCQAARRLGHGGPPAGKICVFRPTFTGIGSSIRLLAVCETQGYKPRSCRSVAQPGRALRSGRRGRRFESCHSDQYSGYSIVTGTVIGTETVPQPMT